MRVQPCRDIIGVKDRDFGGARQPVAAHHQDVYVRRWSGSTPSRTAPPTPARPWVRAVAPSVAGWPFAG